MTRHDYRCSSCGYEQEVMTRAGRPPLRDCPECGTPGSMEVVFKTPPAGKVEGGTPIHHRRNQ